MPVTILVVEDQGVPRAALRALLDAVPDMEVVGEAGEARDALALARTLQPDVTVMDYSLPGQNGIDLTRCLLATNVETRVLILTVHMDAELMWEALNAGAKGYMLWQAEGGDLVCAVRAVARGDTYIHPWMTSARMAQSEDGPASCRPTPEAITPREREILSLIAQGNTNRQTAEILRLSVSTVGYHRAGIRAKPGLHRLVDLVRYVLEHGFLNVDP